MLSFYVYVLRRPCGTPFYVGMGSGNRIDRHEVRARQGEKSHRANIIRKIWGAGGSIGKEIVARYADDKAAKAAERELIAMLGRADCGAGPLVNRTDGGDGVTGWSNEMRREHSALTASGMSKPESRRRIDQRAASMKADPAVLARLQEMARSYWGTEEARAKQSARVKEWMADPENRAKSAAACKAGQSKPEVRAKMSEAAKRRNADPAWRAAHAAKMRELWKDPAYAEKRRAAFAAKRRAA